ncbi:hypothetical protein [Chromobacterium vaccinii]|uniref:hypothetical protein n=1 Tax=Chromobacterium vaccinii TaxID=1108595 RepID=UPI0011863058|nr:hypothetical protein [Chromobacterium vaccinii]
MYTNSCGAVALLCTAKELGVTSIPLLKGSTSEKFNIDTLEVGARCEGDIYAMTSKADPNNLATAGYSMPDGIVTAGRLLGLEMRVVEEAGFFSSALSWIYPDARKGLEGMNCPIENEAPQPAEGQVKIEALAVSVVGVPVGLHWVLSRNDGSYMDPANGVNSANFSDMVSHMKAASTRFASYSPTGISIIATRAVDPQTVNPQNQ